MAPASIPVDPNQQSDATDDGSIAVTLAAADLAAPATTGRNDSYEVL